MGSLQHLAPVLLLGVVEAQLDARLLAGNGEFSNRVAFERCRHHVEVGVLGVALLLISPEAALDPIGIAAGLGGAASMAAGTVLSRKWQPPVSSLAFTAWQLTAGGMILVPLALIVEPPLPPLTMTNLVGLGWLGLVGAAATYAIWFRGIARIEPGAVSMLGMMSPVTAVLLGWVALGQSLSPLQAIGAAIVLGSVRAGQRASRPSAPMRSVPSRKKAA